MTQATDFAALEYLAYWEGLLTAGRLAEILEVSREHAQREIVTAYQVAHPERLALDGRKGWRWNGRFSPEYAPMTASGLVSFLRGRGLADALPGGYEATPAVGVAEPDAEIFREIFQAMAGHEAIGVDALATADAPLADLTFSPHAIFTDARGAVHFRGYAQPFGPEVGGYINLSAAAIRRSFGLRQADGESAWVSGAADKDWHEKTVLGFVLNPALSDDDLYQTATEYAAPGEDLPRTLTIPNVRRAIAPLVAAAHRWRIYESGPAEVWLPAPEKRPAHRPRKLRDGRDYRVYLDEATAEAAKRLGEGSISEGLRRAVALAKDG